MICIEGKRKKKVITPNDKYLQTERRNGPFKRALKVPCSISSFSVDASYLRHGEDCCEAWRRNADSDHAQGGGAASSCREDLRQTNRSLHTVIILIHFHFFVLSFLVPRTEQPHPSGSDPPLISWPIRAQWSWLGYHWNSEYLPLGPSHLRFKASHSPYLTSGLR